MPKETANNTKLPNTIIDEKAPVIEPAGPQDPFNTTHLNNDLKSRSIRGGVITVFAEGCKFALKMSSIIVLARLLTPADFGLIAMVTALTTFAMIFKDLGLSMATIQKPNISQAQISTLFWINVAIGIAIGAAVAAMAPVVAWFYGQPELKNITIALSFSFVLGGLAVQHQALLKRHMSFFKLGLVEVLAMASSVAVAIIAGIYGAGYWSLVIMHIVLAAIMTIGMWIAMPWLPGLPRRKAGVRKMLGFGGNMTGFSVLNYFARNTDNILIGKFLGSAALGFYSKAYQFMLLPIRQLNQPLSSVAIPSLSYLQNDANRYRKYYQRMIRLLSIVIMPIGAFVTIMGRELIIAVLGPQWDLAGQIFQYFGLVMFVQPIVNPVGSLYISQGRGGDILKWGVIGTVLTVSSIVLGLIWGTLGVAICYALMALVIHAPLAIWFVGRKGPVSAKNIFTAVRPILTLSVIITIILYILKLSWAKQTAALQVLLGLAVSLIAILIFLFVFPSGREIFSEIKELIQHIIHKNKLKVNE